MRYYKLCDELDLNYDDIEKLCMWITRPTNQQWKKLEMIDKKYQSIFNTTELDELYDRQKKIRDTYFDEKWETEEALNSLKEKIDDDDGYISLTGINNIFGGTEEKIKQYIVNNEKRIGLYNVLILFVTIITITIVVLKEEEESIAALVVGGLLDLVFLVNKSSFKTGKKIILTFLI